ncbi:MAG: FIVAR domain-containing protein [Clostridiales bacterium]|nr:FIVAR domain-containing protein [Clostridiales bacterium]
MVQKHKALRFSRKLLAALLALVMVLSATPVVFAADDAAETPAQQGHVVSATGTWFLTDSASRAYMYFSTDAGMNADTARDLGTQDTLSYTYVKMADTDVVSVDFYLGTKKASTAGTGISRSTSITPNELASSTVWTVVQNGGHDLSSDVYNSFNINFEEYQWKGTLTIPTAEASTYTATFSPYLETWAFASWGDAETGSGTVTINITVVDKSDLAAVVSEAEALLASDGQYMTALSKDTLETALANAQAQMGDDALDQAAIDNAAAALTGALSMVKYNPADYTNLDAAINAAADIYLAGNNGKYTEESYDVFAAAYDAAVALKTGTDARDQAAIEEAAAALADAQAKLDQIANYTLEQLEELIGEANAFLAENRQYLTEDSIADMEAAISAAQTVLDTQDMTQVDRVYTALKEMEVTYTDADYTALEAAVKAAEDFLASDEAANYETAAKEELQAALDQAAAIEPNMDSRYQATINAMTETVKAAMPTDADLLRANVEALKAAVDAANAKLTEEGNEDYTIASVNALKAQINLANGMLTNVPSILKQNDVNEMEAAVIAATEALQLQRADYTALSQAVVEADTAHAELVASGNYEETALAAYAEAIAAAKQVLADQPYSIREQDKVAAEVATLAAAAPTADDLKPADLSDLNAAIAEGEAAKLDPNYSEYTDHSREMLENALAAAIALRDANPTILQQNDVAAAAQAVRDAVAGLIEAEADYSRLDSIVATAQQMLDRDNLKDSYTQTSIDALQAAVDAANALDRHLPEAQQDVVNAAADAVQKACQALEAYNKVGDVTITLKGSNNGDDEVDGNVIYHTTPWYQTWTSQSVTLGVKVTDANGNDITNADDITIEWVPANWSVDEPEANITVNDDGTATITPTFGVGPRSMWVQVKVTDANGKTTLSEPIKVRFINWDWQK